MHGPSVLKNKSTKGVFILDNVDFDCCSELYGMVKRCSSLSICCTGPTIRRSASALICDSDFAGTTWARAYCGTMIKCAGVSTAPTRRRAARFEPASKFERSVLVQSPVDATNGWSRGGQVIEQEIQSKI